MRPKLSATIMTLNEEQRIRKCLESIRWADEIVVLDSRSTDGTVEICREFTDKIFTEIHPSPAARRARAMELTENEWVLSMDADEFLSPELAKGIQELLESPDLDRCNAYRIPRTTYCLGRWIRHGSWYPNYQTRLTKKSCTEVIDNIPHDIMEVSGRMGKLRHDLMHEPPDRVTDQLRKSDIGSRIFADGKFERGSHACAAGIFFHGFWRFVRNYVIKRGFLDGTPGLIIAILGGVNAFSKQAKLWELEHVGPPETPDERTK